MSDTKKLFIGGIVSSGTTVLKKALLRCGFGTSTGDFKEGQHDPAFPKDVVDQIQHGGPISEEFERWVETYCVGDWFIDKTPFLYYAFPNIEQRLGENLCWFMMTQRDPYQLIASNQRRWSDHYQVGDEEPRGLIQKDHEKILDRLKRAIDFHRVKMRSLAKFRYVRYEDLCSHPSVEISQILEFLGVQIDSEVLYAAGATVRTKPRTYEIEIRVERTRELANELCRLWGYPER